MRSRRLTLTIAATAFLSMPLYLISLEEGPEPRRTGANFPGEMSCIDVDCHSGDLNSGPGSVRITVNGVPVEQYQYNPGETVPVVVRVEDPNQQRWGFQLTARTPDGCLQAGNFSLSPAEDMVHILPTAAELNPPGCPQNSIQFPEHLFPKGTPGGANFEVNWTAPEANFGPVVFAAVGNAANGDKEPEGDNIYTTMATVQRVGAGEPAPKPSISSGGVVVATGTPVVASGSSNAILTIFGQDFAPEGTLALNPETDSDGNIATRLASTCVEINDRRAPLFAVLPTQINLQSPTNPGQGPGSVVVIRACGTPQESRSDPEPLNIADVSPAFFNFVNNADGVNPIAAVHQDNVNLVGPGTLPFPTTPAAPGEFISLYATGLGPTASALEAGEIPSGISQITGTVSVRIGETTVTWPHPDLFYVGISPPFAGLYVVIVKVPDTAPDGNWQVVMTVNGISSPEGPYIAVASP